MLTAFTTPKKVPIVLTTKRLLILGTKGVFEQADSKIVAEIPRADLRAKPPRRPFLWTKVDLTDPQGTPVARMQFPVPARGDAKLIAAALGQPPTPVVAARS